MVQKRFSVVYFMVLFVAALSGCSNNEPPPADAKHIADTYYAEFMAKDIDSAITHFSPKRSPDVWRSHLANINEQLGEVVSVKFNSEEINTVLRGRFFIFEYNVEYSSGKHALEIMTLFHKVNEEGIFIVSHNISADGYTSLL